MKSILSGMLIGIGGTIYLTLENKIIGSILFCIGLISICYFQLPLFTGKVGYLIKKEISIKDLINILIGNLLGALTLGSILGSLNSSLKIVAHEMLENKHQLSYFTTLINSILCGILMYIAVDIFKEKKSIIGILFAIPVFILSGFEHSIAYSFYAGVAMNLDVIFLLISIIGNSIGGCLIPLVLKYDNT